MVTLAGTRGNRELVAIMFASSGRVRIGRQSRIFLSLSRHPLQEHRNRSGNHIGRYRSGGIAAVSPRLPNLRKRGSHPSSRRASAMREDRQSAT